MRAGLGTLSVETQMGTGTCKAFVGDRGRKRMGQTARVDLVLDCADPAKLADFWRAALDYRDYYTDEAISVLVPKEGIA